MTAQRRILPCGDEAFLVELDSLADVLALHAALLADPQPGQTDVVAAARTVLVRAVSPVAAVRLAEYVRDLEVTAQVERDDELVTIDVLYDGADLADVAALLGMSTDALIAAHTGQTWTAAFGGFAPGFTYCIGENQTLNVPRRATPRTAVPAKSVALAGHFSAVYPRETPGGWQLIGRTQQEMWDSTAAKPAFVAPGNRVRYRAVRELIALPERLRPAAAEPTSGLRVVHPGPLTVVEDQGRPGYADMGVSASGAMDLLAAWHANQLVGNPKAFPVLEVLMGGLSVTAIGDQVLAVTGADLPLTVTTPDAAASADRTQPVRPAPLLYRPPTNGPFALLDGQTLTLGAPTQGIRSYVSARGGFVTRSVLGSASADLLSFEGPPPLAAGDAMAIAKPALLSVVQEPIIPPELPGTRVTVHIILGPRDDWFSPDQIDSLLAQDWVVTDRSNRIGLRLDGVPLARSYQGELPSEGTVAGAIQIPADGKPVLFMRDHPVTGGYPVVGVVRHSDLNVLAQLPPGATIRFAICHAPSVADDAPRPTIIRPTEESA